MFEKTQALPLPWSLANGDGTLRKTSKAVLARELEKQVLPGETIPEPSATIIDGMSLVQKMKGNEQTFSQLADSWGDIHQCPGPSPTCEACGEFGVLERGYVSENIYRSSAVTPQVSTVDWGTSIEFAGISTNADSAGFTTVGDAAILTVAGTGRGERSGRAAGDRLPGVEAECSGRGPKEVAAGAAVSLGLRSSLGREAAIEAMSCPWSDLGQMVTETTRYLEDNVNHRNVVT
ncbi:uncharacterized protein LOC126382481 [Epinephelus moara]|uniref:uncharacterized protein LOC126382481 n=1 Tax=Epinephelus moara TaxID=300413 RepID=UPI00214F2A39|nr:uncharacterized protein LOC126382481 [Epinephelus moara]